MKSKVFISCGQATTEEKLVTQNLTDWFSKEGYNPYVAINVQTIMDLNSGIIDSIKNSDYYLFINFRREKIKKRCIQFFLRNNPTVFRGSLYSHQELAIAYALGMDQMILINQKGVENKGLLEFIVSNAPSFETADEVPDKVKKSVESSGWYPTFKRTIYIDDVRFSDHGFVDYRDHTGCRQIKILHGYVKNGRKDITASNTICRLREVEDNNGNRIDIEDYTLLKAKGYIGYQQTIWPEAEASFDLLAISAKNPEHVFLNSARDIIPRKPIIEKKGEYIITYDVIADKYPLTSFQVKLYLSGVIETTKAELINTHYNKNLR